MKIHIIGCSGTGKSYLAKRLSEKYNIPHFDLDDIFWDNSSDRYGVKMPDEKRNLMLEDFYPGIYLSTSAGPRSKKAFLSPPAPFHSFS